MVSSWDDLVYMQDMTPAACLEGNPNGKTLIDIRDGKSYTIAKLNDGKCWMTQNLSIIDKTISSKDSDINDGNFTIPTSDISGFTSSDQYQPKAYYHASYGGYYNWHTATAGYGNSSITTDGANVEYSICPKGWRLPPNTGSGSYSTLLTSYGAYQSGTLFYGNQSILASPLNFVYGGYVGNSSLSNASENGRYWSSTAYDAFITYSLGFSTSVNPSGSSYRYYGFSVRCVAR